RFDALTREVPELGQRKRRRHPGPQGGPGDELHHDEQIGAEIDDVVDRGDAPIADLARPPRLFENRSTARDALFAVRTEALEGHRAVEQRVVGEKDLAHSSVSEYLLDAEASHESLARQTRRVGGVRGGSFGWVQG